jgi:glycosyltransferase involved in cell wall biosynthesis
VPVQRLALEKPQRRRLTPWVRLYWFMQGPAIEQISAAMLPHLRAHATELTGDKPTVVHNSRVGREGLTVASLKLARELNVPFVLTPNHHHHWRGWFYRHYIRVYQEADAVIAHTEFERDELARLGVRPERIHIIGVGPVLADKADGARFRQKVGLPPDVPVVLFLGQKYPYKRFERLLAAAPLVWHQFPDTRFLFIGPRTQHSQQVFAGVHDARILEMDTVDMQTKTDALAACDVLAMPSARESFGGVYLEAWEMQKPVIGGDAPALKYVIQEGKTGFLVGDDITQLADRLLTLLHDSNLRAQMGTAGKQTAARYNWSALTEQLADVYRALR